MSVRAQGDLGHVLGTALGPGKVITDAVGRSVYGMDASQRYAEPSLVVLAETGDDIAETIAQCVRLRRPFVVRGRGTGYTGGAVPLHDAVVISTERWREPIMVDPDTRTALVSPGITLGEIDRAAAAYGLFFPVDPISKEHCSVGGALAENAAGPRCLVFGPAHQYTLGFELFDVKGRRRWMDRSCDDFYALLASEGTLGLIGRCRLRLVKRPPQIELVRIEFDDPVVLGRLQERLYAMGTDFTALEMVTPSYSPAQGRVGGYSLWAEAFGPLPSPLLGSLERALEDLPVVLHREATGLYQARGQGYQRARQGLLDELARHPCAQLIDGVVPRARLAQAVEFMFELAARMQLPMTHTFHFGDGNIHPTFFHAHDPGPAQRKELVLERVCEFCVSVGGSLGGEHGIGLEKQALLERRHAPEEVAAFRALKDRMDPDGLCNPGKIFPQLPANDAPSATGTAIDDFAWPLEGSTEPCCHVDAVQATLTADARCPIGVAARAARDAGLWLAFEGFGVDPLTPIAAVLERSERVNLWSLIYGQPSDQLLAATFTDHEGMTRRLGSQMVKDISGYMLHRMRRRPPPFDGPLSRATVRLWKRPRTASYRVLAEVSTSAISRVATLTDAHAFWLYRSSEGTAWILHADVPRSEIMTTLRSDRVTLLDDSSPHHVLGPHAVAEERGLEDTASGLRAFLRGELHAWVPQLARGIRLESRA